MKLQEAIQTLRKHNDWRRGKNDEQGDPKLIGEAIDKVLAYVDFELEYNKKT